MTLWQEPIMTPTPRWVFGCVCLVNDSFEKSTYNYYFEDFIPWILWLLIAWKVEKFKSVETEYFSILGSCFDFRTSWLVWCFKKFRSYIESYLFRWILKMMTFILTVVCLENHCGITALLLLKGTGSSLDVSWPLGVGFDRVSSQAWQWETCSFPQKETALLRPGITGEVKHSVDLTVSHCVAARSLCAPGPWVTWGRRDQGEETHQSRKVK